MAWQDAPLVEDESTAPAWASAPLVDEGGIDAASTPPAAAEDATLTTAMSRGIGGLLQGGSTLAMGANQRVLDTMDRIDRGERVLDTDDPVGYQYMAPPQRQAARAQLTKALGGNVEGIARHAQTLETYPELPAVKRLKESKTFGEVWDAFASDPVRVIGHLGAESLPAMAPGMAGAVIAGPVGGAAAGAAAMGAGSYSAEYASGILQALQEEGVDVRNPESIRAKIADPELMRRVREKAATKATVVGALDAASGAVASRSLIPARAATRPVVAEAGNLAAQAPVQGALGAAGEAGGALAAGDEVSPGAVAAEFLGEFAGSPAEVATMVGSRAPVAAPAAPSAAPPVDSAPVEPAPPAAPPAPEPGIPFVPPSAAEVAAMRAENLTSAPGVAPAPVGNEIAFEGLDPAARAVAIEQAQAAEVARQADAATRIDSQPIDMAQEKAATMDLAPSPVPLVGNEIDIRPFLEERALLKAAGLTVEQRLGEGDILGRPFEQETIEIVRDLDQLADANPAALRELQAEIESFKPEKEESRAPAPEAPSAPAPAQDASLAQVGTKDRAAPAVAPADTGEAAAIPAEAVTPPAGEGAVALAPPQSAVAVPPAPVQSEAIAAPSEPARAEQATGVDVAAHEAASSPQNDLPEPTKAQILAGNAKLGHVKVAGLDVSIENPAGSVREDKAHTPPRWRTTMRSHYGYFRGAEGADGDKVDAFVKQGTPEDFSGPVFVVDQVKANGRFDEHKVVLGAASIEEAKKLYRENYTRGFKVGPVTELTQEKFKAWLASPYTKRAVKSLATSEWKKIEDAVPRAPEQVSRLQAVEREIGWAEVGGRMIREADTGGEKPEVVGRTSWVPKSNFWPERPTPKSITQGAARAALRKVAAGQRLSTSEQRFIDYAEKWLDEQDAATKAAEEEARRARAEEPILPEELDTAGLKPTDAADAALVARAVEIDPGRVEALAIQYEDDDAGFLAAVKEIINDPDHEAATRRETRGEAPAEDQAPDRETALARVAEAAGAIRAAKGAQVGALIPELDAARNAAEKAGATSVQIIQAMEAKRRPLGPEKLAEALERERPKAKASAVDKQLFVEYEGKRYPVSSLDEASRKWDQFRQEATRQGAGASDIAPAHIVDGSGKRVWRIAYNGRIFDGEKLVHDPYAPGELSHPRNEFERPQSPVASQTKEAAKPALDLKGETEAEIRARDAREKQAAEAKKKREAAPEPKDFTLTGSDRQVDEARARGQQELVQAAEALPPVEPPRSVETMPATAEKATEAQVERIADFGEKIGGARKDTAVPLGPRTMSVEQDDRPGWARKYIAMQVLARDRMSRPETVGKWQLMKETGGLRGSVQPVNRSMFFDTEAEALAAIPRAEVSRNHRVFGYKDGDAVKHGIYRIMGERRRALVKGGFASEDAAMREMATNPVAIIEHKFAFPERPWLDRIERTGEPRRSGNVTPSKFKETFGFRGGEFGNWNMGGDGQAALNHAYDALLDLAEALGVPPKALSLNGDLAIAFGARGHGGKDSAAAHYERDLRVMNLTKIKGAGSLAHEWFHALDHYLGSLAGKREGKDRADSYLTYGPGYRNNEARPELLKAFRAVVDAMTVRTEGVAIEEEGAKRGLTRAQENVAYKLGQLRSYIDKPRSYGAKKSAATAEQLKAWDELAARAEKGDGGAQVHVPGNGSRLSLGYTSNEVVRGLNDIYKKVTGRSFDRADHGSDGRQLYWAITSLKDMNDRVAKAQEGAIETRRRGTHYLDESKKIDGYRASDYWSTPHEMGARAFESYIFDRLAGQERKSQYLVHAVENKFYRLLDMKPYPEGDERIAINRAFDDLFAAIQTKETDKGVAMFARHRNQRARGGGVNLEDARALARTIRLAFPIYAVESKRKWPSALLKDVAEAPHPETITGAFKDGEIWLDASQFSSLEEMQHVILHEGWHGGLRGVVGDELDPVLISIYQTNPSVKSAVAAFRQMYPKMSVVRSTEEVLVDMGASGEATKLEGWPKFVAALKDWLRRHGFTAKFLRDFTDADVLYLLQRAGRVASGAERGVASTGYAALSPEAKFARSRESAPLDFPGVTPPAAPAAPATPAGRPPAARATATPASNPWSVDDPTRLENLRYVLQDKHIDTKAVVKAIEKAGAAIPDQSDPYLQEELFHGRAAKGVKDFLEYELKPLMKDMATRGVKIADFEEWLHARHAEERNLQIAKVNPDMPDEGSGMTTADAKAVLARATAAGLTRAYTALAARVDAINAKTRQELVAYGLEAPSTIAAWDAAYKAYVPLQREDMDGVGTGQGFSVRGSQKRATGSTRAVVDILANIAMQRERAIVRGEKNRVANALVGLATANPNPDFWKVDVPPKVTRIDERTGLVVTSVDPLYKSQPNVLMARIPDASGNIVEHAVVFNEHDERAARMAKSLKGLDVDQLLYGLGVAAKFTRWFASMNTQWNPIFGVVNLTRDTQSVLLNLSTTPIAGKQREVFGHAVSALRGIYSDLRAERRNQQPTSAWAALWDEMQIEGGRTGYRDLFATSADRAKALQEEIDRHAGGVKQAPKVAVEAVLGWLSDYNDSMENALRLATYKTAIDHGVSKQRAASIAKNISVNFNRKGAVTTQAAALYAFFNASVQGTTRTLATLSGPKGLQIITGGVLLGVLQAVALSLADLDDDEPPEFIREKKLVIPIGGKKYLTIPMAQGFLVLPNLGRIATEFVLSGFRKPAERVASLFTIVLESSIPVGASSTVAQTLSPTAFDPIVALGENKDWTGKPIAREDFNRMHPTPGHTRAKDTASEFSKTMSRAINALSGGTAHKPGVFSPTPDQIDYLLAQFAGGVGREVMKVEQTVMSTVTGEKLPPYKVPLLGRFYGDADSASGASRKFYSNLEEINRHGAEIKGRTKAGEPLGDYLKENPEARLAARARAEERKVSELRRQKRALQAKGAPKARITEIEDTIARRQAAFNEAVRAARQ